MFTETKLFCLTVLLLCVQYSTCRNQCEIAAICISDKTCPEGEYLHPMTGVYDCCATCRPKPGNIDFSLIIIKHTRVDTLSII